MSARSTAGREAKLAGHMFENVVAEFLKTKLNTNIIVEGAPGTKIDLMNESGDMRFSLKKTPSDLQVGLITQENFIDAMGISDSNVIAFIKDFFGGDQVADYPRHRKNLDQISDNLSKKFLDFMNSHKEDILKIAVTHGSLAQTNSINYILYPSVKHDVNTLNMIDVDRMNEDFVKNGEWVYSPQKTSLHFYCNGVKIMALQMFGSGPKYKNGYHSLQFRIACGKINGSYVTKV